MLAISSLLATGWISQPLRQRPHRTAAPLRWDEILCGMTQVVTDIDDTIKSSGGVNIGGIALGGVDTSYERNSFYPGVFQFGLELASHTAKPRDPPNNMAVLTARAVVRRRRCRVRVSSGTSCRASSSPVLWTRGGCEGVHRASPRPEPLARGFCSHRGAFTGVQVGARDQTELEAVHAVQVRLRAAIVVHLVRARARIGV